MMSQNNKVVIVFSGGQDSTTCFGIAKANNYDIFCITFNYGQIHTVELEQAQKICTKYQANFKEFTIPNLTQISSSSLLKDSSIEPNVLRSSSIPSTFVPNRNALFLTLAHSYAQSIGANKIYIGVSQVDYSGYPDCRIDFIKAIEHTLNLSSETDIEIVTPLIYKTKAQTFALAAEVGFLECIINDSHTCYAGDRTHKHAWGYGCATCAACILRAKGWDEFTKKT